MPQIRVLIVDDAVVVRRMLTDVLDADPDIVVAGTAPNGRIALAKIRGLQPDLVTLDIEMPEMDGLEALAAIRKTNPALPVIMFSTLTVRGGAATLDALTLGATDYLTKPANVGSVSEGIERIREELIPGSRLFARPASDPRNGRCPNRRVPRRPHQRSTIRRPTCGSTPWPSAFPPAAQPRWRN